MILYILVWYYHHHHHHLYSYLIELIYKVEQINTKKSELKVKNPILGDLYFVKKKRKLLIIFIIYFFSNN